MSTKLSQEEFKKRSNKIHKNKYDYSKSEYNGYYETIIITCPTHGDFPQKPTNHMRGSGCQKCGDESSTKLRTLSKEDFLEKAIKTHGNKYNYSEIKYVNTETKVKIICPEHGSFWKKPTYHYKRKQGCPTCQKIKNYKNSKKDIQDFIDKANEIHGDRYDYGLINKVNSNDKIEIICPQHGSFTIRCFDHIRTDGNCSGCSKCGELKSKSENMWLNSLKNKDNIIMQKKIYYKTKTNKRKYYKVDGYDPTTNTVYEFLGDIWHGNFKFKTAEQLNPKNKKSMSKLYIKTVLRFNHLQKLGYNIKFVWENDWKTGKIFSEEL